MPDNDEFSDSGPTRNLPMVVEQPEKRGRFANSGLPASFVAQLIAARENLDVQRKLRRSPHAKALGAYADSAESMVQRMPAGYGHKGEA